jgi:hypothetical protein
MKKMIRILVVALLATQTLSTYAEKPKDIQGWDKAEWGMTEAQVMAAFGKHAERHEKDLYAEMYSTVRITGFSYNNIAYRADMLFDNNSEKLTGINLRVLDEKSLKVVDEFKKQSILLKTAFGNPSEETPTKQMWRFPSTTIKLEFKPITSLFGVNIFGVYFRQNQNKEEKSPTKPSTPTK